MRVALRIDFPVKLGRIFFAEHGAENKTLSQMWNSPLGRTEC